MQTSSGLTGLRDGSVPLPVQHMRRHGYGHALRRRLVRVRKHKAEPDMVGIDLMYPQETGLPMWVFISSAALKEPDEPHIKVSRGYGYDPGPSINWYFNWFSVTLNEPRIVGDTGAIKLSDLVYVEKFVLRNRMWLLRWWDSDGDLRDFRMRAVQGRLALHALASGADVNASYRTPRAQLVKEAATRQAAAVGDKECPDSPGACGDVTVLHAAAAAGGTPLLEFLLQNGANWEHLDASGLSPLHYAMLHDHSGCAKLLLRRGADSQQWRDGRGRNWSALDFAMQKGRVSDDELLVLLSKG